MTDQKAYISLVKIVFDHNKQERKSWSRLRQTCSWPLIVILSEQFVILLIDFGCFCRNFFQKVVMKQLSGWKCCVLQQGTFYPQQDFEQINFHKKMCLYIVRQSVRDGKLITYSYLAQKWEVRTKIWQILLFLLTPATTLRCSAEIDNLDFVQGSNFEFIDSLKTTVQNTRSCLTIHGKRFVIQ